MISRQANRQTKQQLEFILQRYRTLITQGLFECAELHIYLIIAVFTYRFLVLGVSFKFYEEFLLRCIAFNLVETFKLEGSKC